VVAMVAAFAFCAITTAATLLGLGICRPGKSECGEAKHNGGERGFHIHRQAPPLTLDGLPAGARRGRWPLGSRAWAGSLFQLGDALWRSCWRARNAREEPDHEGSGRRPGLGRALCQRGSGAEKYLGVARFAGRALVAARPSRALLKEKRVSALRAAIADAGCISYRTQFGHGRTPLERRKNPTSRHSH